MTTETAVATTNGADKARELALLKAIGFDRLAPEQRELALSIANRYDLDPMLKHLVIIDGKPFITRDGLLWVAHRSGKFDGIAVTEPEIRDGFWRCMATVWRKDWSHPTEYHGRYPTTGGNQKFAPEMAMKVAESLALRRAFNVAAPVAEERWDAEVPAEPAAPVPTLAERAAQRAAIVVEPTPQEAASEPSVVTETAEAALVSEAASAPTGQGQPEAAGASSGNGGSAEPNPEPTAEPPAPLTKQQFVGRLASSPIDRNHASALRLVMFPDINAELSDAQRGELWSALEAEQASVSA